VPRRLLRGLEFGRQRHLAVLLGLEPLWQFLGRLCARRERVEALLEARLDVDIVVPGDASTGVTWSARALRSRAS